ncbi:bifunctional 3-(3-hydroxy-phenyl)propionate/3-hydroxycinnamic acid hydroxylase [Sphingomonas prati]|uniref:3-(3-hydroxy-phenyl)propionate hydroxylase n=1 Tax=Sphingomonas prati TaxID=1843237 RepID=A0A7W9BV90_9SPHN|nr:bifunctional 3-(3-hydroxy-phenyl)propionate/3-hydroxycinnamic acid hydroxylase [Sphingomonas prati]MBB5730752.1 3-(3-hydroxy-phenyl)propionate hydroxylase [Sphingomonas prati]GGE96494.1 3-(3-hydroxy-phenyl)propionate/3-hydroxycinnamic acid hydroxylase [Sphingomonas prati]
MTASSTAAGAADRDRRTIAAHYPVIVVGGGPTGLALANLLSRYGTRALLIERNATTVQEPRAVSIDDESLRTMQSAGVIERILPGIVPGYGSEYRSPRGRKFLHVRPDARPYGYPRRNAFRQPVFEAQLRGALAASPIVDTLFGWTLERFHQDGQGVTLHLVADGARRIVSCDYLVAADGGRSPIRSALGLSLDGETFEEKWLIVDLENSPAATSETVVFCDARRPCIALPGPDLTRRFEFKLLADENPEDLVAEDRVQALLASHGAHPDSVLRRKVVYTFHARVAPRWSSGRVYLAGDACHLTPPFAGQGMNSCIRDAHNLAWKLAWVTAGRMPAALLDSYEAERRKHVHDMIQLALRMGRIMGPRNRMVGLATRTAFTALGLWPVARDYLAQMKYKPKPRFASGFLLPDGLKGRHTLVGRLLPQPLVERPGGDRILLDEVLGDNFALVGRIEDSADLLRIGDMPAFAALRPRIVAVADGTGPITVPVDLPADLIVVYDRSGTLAHAVGRDRRLLVVRPDRYVFTTFPVSRAEATAALLEGHLTPDSGSMARRTRT